MRRMSGQHPASSRRYVENGRSIKIMAATIEELQQAAGELNSRLDHLHEFLKIDDYLKKIAELENKMSAPDFWNN
jgi:hypothetical protein